MARLLILFSVIPCSGAASLELSKSLCRLCCFLDNGSLLCFTATHLCQNCAILSLGNAIHEAVPWTFDVLLHGYVPNRTVKLIKNETKGSDRFDVCSLRRV